jgi:hypothetical protein
MMLVVTTMLRFVPCHRFLAARSNIVGNLSTYFPGAIEFSPVRNGKSISQRTNQINPFMYFLALAFRMVSLTRDNPKTNQGQKRQTSLKHDNNRETRKIADVKPLESPPKTIPRRLQQDRRIPFQA